MGCIPPPLADAVSLAATANGGNNSKPPINTIALTNFPNLFRMVIKMLLKELKRYRLRFGYKDCGMASPC
jgi:hypothetical protein